MWCLGWCESREENKEKTTRTRIRKKNEGGKRKRELNEHWHCKETFAFIRF